MKKIYLFLALAIAVAINANAEWNLQLLTWENGGNVLNGLSKKNFTQIDDYRWILVFDTPITLEKEEEFLIKEVGKEVYIKTYDNGARSSWPWSRTTNNSSHFKLEKGTYSSVTIVNGCAEFTVSFNPVLNESESYTLLTWSNQGTADVLHSLSNKAFTRISEVESVLVFDNPIELTSSEQFLIMKGSSYIRNPHTQETASNIWYGTFAWSDIANSNFTLAAGKYYSATIKNGVLKFNTYAKTSKGLDALYNKDADYVEIMTDIYVSHHWGGYYSICTTTEGSQAKQPILEEGKEQDIVKWGDNPDNFAQLDWFRIAYADNSLSEKQFQAGTIVSVADKKVVKLGDEATPVTFTQSLNIYRPISFAASKEDKEKFFLVTPQDGEKAKVRGRYTNVAGNDYLTDNNGRMVKFLNNTKVTFVDDDNQWYEVVCYINKEALTGTLELVVLDAQVATGVESVETANATVFAANGTINVSSDAEASIEVYTANGQMVRAINADNASIAVAPGFYLVKVGNQVSKVVVK